MSDRCLDATSLEPDVCFIEDAFISSEDAFTDSEDMLPSTDFTNDLWLKFRRDGYLETTHTTLRSTLDRTSCGEVDDQAWTISLYLKTGDTPDELQPILYYGAGTVEENHWVLYWTGKTRDKGRKLILTYGVASNQLELHTPEDSVRGRSPWYHLMITYNGGTIRANGAQTGENSAQFKIFINGILQSLTRMDMDHDIDETLQGLLFRVGRLATTSSSIAGCKIDELAIWDSDQSSNISAIYHGGVARDLTQLASVPTHWWRLGDGDVFPTLTDQIGEAHLTMYGMSADDITNMIIP